MYAPASVLQAAPATTAYAAPATTAYAAPVTYAQPVVAQAAVAAPVAEVAAPAASAPSFSFPPFPMPAPVSMTAGLPTPEKLAAERTGYDKALDAQLAKQSNAVMEEAKIKQAMLKQACTNQIAQRTLELEEKCKMDCFDVERQAMTMVNGLKEAAIIKRTEIEEGAAIKIAEFKKKSALEQMDKESYTLKKEWFEKEAKFTYEYQKVMQAGSRAVAPGYGLEQVAPVPTYQGAMTAVPAATFAAAPMGGATYASYAAAPIQNVANYGAVGTSTIV